MKEKKFNKRSELIVFFLKGSKRYFALAVVFVCLLVLFELVNPKIVGYTVDFIIGSTQSIPAFLLAWVESLGGREYVLGNLWIFSLLVIGIAVFGAMCRYCFQLFNSMGAEHLVKNMRDTLYNHIIHLPYEWHDANKTGDIIQRCTSDVDMIKNFISSQMTNLFRMVALIGLALYFMIGLHPVLAIVAVVFIPIVILYSLFFHKSIEQSFEKVDTEEGKLSAIAQENLTGVRVVRAFGREKYERERFETKNEEYTQLWVVMMRILGSFWVINDVISGIEVMLIITLGAYFTIKGDMTAGNYVSFISYNGLLIFPVRQLGRLVSELSKAGVSIDRIMYIMNSEEEQDAMDAVDFPENGDIVFDKVSFAYKQNLDNGNGADAKEKKTETAEKVINNLSLTIKKGQTIGILGGTGAGKSTLIQLLDNLYELDKDGGKITINGVDISKIKKSELRKNIGMVLQEPYLFSRSIEENIKIANDNATHKDVEQVVATASLDSSIDKFKDGYETYVGERGVTLSGGQKQRTAIAQMLIREPKIMIFDDSLSAVDAKTDAHIRSALKGIGDEDTTTIIISHRITTIMHADNILVLENGKIKESGSHEELMAYGGRYRKIFDLQSAQE